MSDCVSCFFFFSSRRRHTRCSRDWSSDVCSSDLEQRLVAVGRITTVLLVGLGLLWIPFMKYISPQIYIYLQSVQAYIAPPIAACFLLGVLYPRLNGTGALAALWTGLVIGTARLVLELARSDLASGTVWYWFATRSEEHTSELQSRLHLV